MKVIIASAIFASAFVSAQDEVTNTMCYKCENTNFYVGGEITDASNNLDCYHNDGVVAECNSATEVCYATMTWRDGFPATVKRDCVTKATDIITPISDLDIVVDENGDGSACWTDPNSNENIQTCGITCSADGCNGNDAFEITTFKECNCVVDGQYCDYWTGVCSCPVGEEPTDKNDGTNEQQCATPAVVTVTAAPETASTATPVVVAIECVQCSTDVFGDSCATGNIAAISCGADDSDAASQYIGCAAILRLTLTQDGRSVREVIERGCSTQTAMSDTCQFENPANKDDFDSLLTTVDVVADYECKYVCNTDGCNTMAPTGSAYTVPEVATMYSCYTGTSDANCSGGSCSSPSATVSCEFGCKSELVYLENNNLNEVLKYETGCATEAELNQKMCTKNSMIDELLSENYATIAESTDELVRVPTSITNCLETCTESLCNIGMPARPTCFACTGSDLMTNDDCFMSFDMTDSTMCNYNEDMCYIRQIGVKHESSTWADTNAEFIYNYMSPGIHSTNTGSEWHGPHIMRMCGNSAVLDVENTYDSDNYRCETLYNENGVETVDCTFRCDSDWCNFGPALKYDKIPVTVVTPEPFVETTSSSYVISVSLLLATILVFLQ